MFNFFVVILLEVSLFYNDTWTASANGAVLSLHTVGSLLLVGPGRFRSRHVFGCYLAQETRVQDALDDVASNVCRTLPAGGGGGHGAGVAARVHGVCRAVQISLAAASSHAFAPSIVKLSSIL